ncbi:chromosomal replication initiator protein DnaA [Oscillospiraceae bacterium 21-37]|uniref:chromosomal replication initiator protein DnaA n=1 Tax=Eubacteriales TaxID=186802 RepID=UPI00136BCBFC|nr:MULTISPECIES: chromosomal replication initiator protein DnaA [unclassified Neglectibacter]MCI8286012.1 chromosomal replication initiator protein DnaA [Bacillota bacterium]MCI8922029.1 chromosomal replication initiator protein DnaA [Acutalibacter sp.]MCI9115926.1 chromosomal replication initiator protein DnaA [Acutalibacter sp.]NBI17915.1 chromosomal replication initiator protein DnaA [Neglectibacter sp. 59]NBJ73546.1 chromosomal replication initiator protein DnaA [Neglectibacter sp. X4]
MDSFEQAWELICEYCKSQITGVAYKTWFSSLKPVSLDFENNVATIEAPNEFHMQTLLRGYADVLNRAFESVFGAPIQLSLVVPQADAPAKQETPAPDDDSYELTFDTFVVGPSNRFAHAACQAVAAKPALLYNPLFIYGNSGLGKTHLLSAVSKEFMRNFPDRSVVYVKSEDFTNEIIDAIARGTTAALRAKYRSADLLLIDDVQFIAGKNSTQEEFFHTFNTLHEAKKQIILTSDRPPKDIATLEDRLKTRFEWGLTADIQPPDYETRISIINRKAASMDFTIPENVSEYIANRLKSNVRQLEGAVKKLRAFHLLENKPINVATAQSAISDIMNNSQPTPVTVDKIIEEVARTYLVAPEDIRSQKRNSVISTARQVSIYIVREITQMSMVEIGQTFGGRDHSTIVYALRQMESKLERDPRTRDTVDDIIKNIRSR